MNHKIAVIGTGYVGLVAGACLAELGNKVICVDKDQNKIEKLNKGIVPIYEPGLGELIKRNINRQKLFFAVNLPLSIQESEIVFICVGTPPARNGKADLSSIKKVALEIGKSIGQPKIIVIKSTVPVGTGRNIVAKIISNYYSGSFDIASNPEFLREGSAVSDFLHPDRVVIGVDSPKTGKILSELYRGIAAPKLITTIESAEMIKYASNAFLATKISFINEIANICENAGGDIEEIAKGVGLDKRIGKHFLRAGIGYGGSCLPKDTRALHQIAGANGYNFRVLKSAIEVNEYQRKKIIQKVKQFFPEKKVRNKAIAVLGLAFKGNTDDIRESAAIEVIKRLYRLGASIRAYDPQATENAKRVLDTNIQFCSSPYSAAKGADVLLIATDWDEFRRLDWQKIKKLLRNPAIIDGRNLLNPIKIKKLGFYYSGIGR